MAEEKTEEKEIVLEVSEEAKQAMKKKKKKVKKRGVIDTKAKKKTSVARAVAKKGTGVIKINKRKPELFRPYYLSGLIMEPIKLAEDAINDIDITVRVFGGGFMSQALAARSAIAKAIIEHTKDKKLKEKFLKYDKLLLVDDPRRVEPKKPLGKKARRKKQKSKR